MLRLQMKIKVLQTKVPLHCDHTGNISLQGRIFPNMISIFLFQVITSFERHLYFGLKVSLSTSLDGYTHCWMSMRTSKGAHAWGKSYVLS